MHRISIDGMSLINSTKSSVKLNWNYMILFVTNIFFKSSSVLLDYYLRFLKMGSPFLPL